MAARPQQTWAHGEPGEDLQEHPAGGTSTEEAGEATYAEASLTSAIFSLSTSLPLLARCPYGGLNLYMPVPRIYLCQVGLLARTVRGGKSQSSIERNRIDTNVRIALTGIRVDTMIPHSKARRTILDAGFCVHRAKGGHDVPNIARGDHLMRNFPDKEDRSYDYECS